MKRLWGRLLASTVAVGAAIALNPGCANNDSTLFVVGVLVPPGRTATGICEYKPDPAAVILSVGRLDAAFTGTYDAMLLVGSQLLGRSNAEEGRTETSRIMLQGTTVRVTDSAGNELSSFTRLGAGIAEPQRGTQAGFGLIWSTLLDPTSARAAVVGIPPGTARRLVAYFKVFGQTLGGRTVESNEYQFPIDVCYRCLVDFGGANQDDARAERERLPNCAGKTEVLTKVPCKLGQDVSVPCTYCVKDYPVCNPLYVGDPSDPSAGQQTPLPTTDGG